MSSMKRLYILALCPLLLQCLLASSAMEVAPGRKPAGNDDDLVKLKDMPSFEKQVKPLLAEANGEYEERLCKIRTQAKKYVYAWEPSVLTHRDRSFSNVASSMFSEYERGENRRFFKSYGYNFGVGIFIASSHYIHIQGDRGRRLNNRERPIADNFIDMDAFRRAAANPNNPTPPVETDWAVGFYHNPEASQITMISSGKTGLWLVLMEEDGELLRPRYITRSDTRHVIPLRMTPDGARRLKYHVLVVGANYLQMISKFAPKLPQNLSDMEDVIRQGISMRRSQDTSTLTLLINLQEALPDSTIPPPQQSPPERRASARAEGNMKTVAKPPELPRKLQTNLAGVEPKATWFTFHQRGPKHCRNAIAGTCFPHYLSVARTFEKVKNSSNSVCGFILQSSTIAFSTSLRKDNNNSLLRDSNRATLKLNFDTMEAFKASLELNDSEQAIGVQLVDDGAALAVARFGRTPLTVVIFKENLSMGTMRPLDQRFNPDELVKVPIEGHPHQSRTCEYWVAFVSTTMVKALRKCSGLQAGELGFRKTGQGMWKKVSKKLALPEKSCNERQFYVFRLKPLTLPKNAAPAAAAPAPAGPTTKMFSLHDLVIAAAAAIEEEEKKEMMVTITAADQPHPTHSIVLQRAWDARAQALYVGRQLTLATSPSDLNMLTGSFSQGGVYLSGSFLAASRHYEDSREGRDNLRRLVAVNPQPAMIHREEIRSHGVTLLVGLDCDAGQLHLAKSPRCPLTLISLWTRSCTGSLIYREIKANILPLTMPIEFGVPTIYAVVNRQILPLLPELLANQSMPRTTAELESLAVSLDCGRHTTLKSKHSSESDWPLRVALFTAYLSFNDAIKGDEATDPDSESSPDSE